MAPSGCSFEAAKPIFHARKALTSNIILLFRPDFSREIQIASPTTAVPFGVGLRRAYPKHAGVFCNARSVTADSGKADSFCSVSGQDHQWLALTSKRPATRKRCRYRIYATAPSSLLALLKLDTIEGCLFGKNPCGLIEIWRLQDEGSEKRPAPTRHQMHNNGDFSALPELALEQKTLRPLDNPFSTRLLPMS
ncbi:hypothetical protein AAFX91_14340 [Bradyrhizobium sp. 31Argb]|uniref:hypothetical protein n=1 Tax=Bradyrhizobium sp. 31Argb TaxID=3141247 RepID=UPI003748E305